MTMAGSSGAAHDANVAASDSDTSSQLAYLQRVVDATAAGVAGAQRKLDRADEDKEAAELAYEQAEAQHAQALGALNAFKDAAGVED